MGLVALAALAFLGNSLDFWDRSGQWGKDERDIRLIDRSFQHYVGDMFTGPLPQGEENGFVGEEESMSGLVEGETGLERAGFRYDNSGQSLAYWKEIDGVRKKVPLIDEIDHFELSYLEPERGWQSSWETQTPLPRAIRIRWSIRNKVQPTLMLPIHGGRSIPSP